MFSGAYCPPLLVCFFLRFTFVEWFGHLECAHQNSVLKFVF